MNGSATSVEPNFQERVEEEHQKRGRNNGNYCAHRYLDLFRNSLTSIIAYEHARKKGKTRHKESLLFGYKNWYIGTR